MDESDRAAVAAGTETLLTLRVEAGALAATVMPASRAGASSAGSQDRYREILGNVLEGIAMIDAKGITASVNQQMAAMLGHSAAAMLGRPFCDFLQGESRISAARHLARGAAGLQEHFDAQLRLADGNVLHAVVSIHPIFPEAEQLAGAVVVITDVTRRTLEERARHQADTLRSVAALAAAVKHEINNPLATLRANLELLEQAGTLDATGRAQLLAALTAADEITRKVARFGRLARLELAEESVALPTMLDLDKSSREQRPPERRSPS